MHGNHKNKMFRSLALRAKKIFLRKKMGCSVQFQMMIHENARG